MPAGQTLSAGQVQAAPDKAKKAGSSWTPFGHKVFTVLWWRWKLQTGADVDMSPSLHWPAPIMSSEAAADRGPVLVTVEYRVPAQNQQAFLEAMTVLKQERHRDGAYNWGLYRDAGTP